MRDVIDTPRRSGTLVAVVLLAHLMLISSQVDDRRGQSLLEFVVFGSFGEIQRVVSHGVGGIGGVWQRYVDLRGVRDENEALRSSVASLQLELQEQRSLARRAERLERLLSLQGRVPLDTLAAGVIGSDATAWFQTVTIDRGRVHGVRADQAVIAAEGVVGRVSGRPGPGTAMVQLLLDHNAAAGAVIERTRAGGIVLGMGADQPLRMEYVPPQADVQVGDLVVTSGIDGLYPKGYVIGRVAGVEEGTGLYQSLTIQPNVDFSAVEEVLVVIGNAPEEVAAEGGS